MNDNHLLSRWVCWCVILVTIAALAVRVQIASSSSTRPTSDAPDNATFRSAARAAVGTKSLEQFIGASSASDIQRLIQTMDDAAATPREKICAAIVIGEVINPQEALTRLNDIDPHGNIPIKQDLDAFKEIYQTSPQAIDAQTRQRLLSRYDWYAKLALAWDLPVGNPQHDAAVSFARVTTILLTLLSIAFVVLLLAGFVLLVVALVFMMDGKFTFRFPALAPRIAGAPPVFLEAFAIYIVGFVGMGAILPRVVHVESLAWNFLALLLLPIVMIWSIARGVTWREVRNGLGWCAPPDQRSSAWRAAWREPLLGIVGYITGLPVVALGFAITLLLARIARASPTNPIINYLHGSTAQLLVVYLLACAWAPIMEETMFRGALLCHLRARHRWFISSLIVGVLFAAVHPQGWTAIPGLAAVGMVLCWIREWRGSIVASMTAHALNNAVVLSLALLLLR